MEAPTLGGMRVRKGNGETVRLARGASLTDFAEKVGVDAAQLVQPSLRPQAYSTSFPRGTYPSRLA